MGVGLDRIPMLRKGLDDIRLLRSPERTLTGRERNQLRDGGLAALHRRAAWWRAAAGAPSQGKGKAATMKSSLGGEG